MVIISADNGVYILRTRDPQYRVVETNAIDHIYWQDGMLCENPVPENVYALWGGCQHTKSQDEATRIAWNMVYDGDHEYGIRIIKVPYYWKEIEEKAFEKQESL